MTIASISFTSTGTSASFDVLRLNGTEAMSTLYRFDLTLVGAPGAAVVAAGPLIGKAARLTISSQGTGTAPVSVPYFGVVTRFEQCQQVGSGPAARIYYKARLEPRLVKLRETRVSAVFVDATYDPDATPPVAATQTVRTVVEKILNRHRQTMPDLLFEFRQVESALRGREYLCQFEESDFDFISHLMESEGLYYFFEHSETEQKEKLVITSSRNAHPLPTAGKRPTIRVRSAIGTGVDDDAIDSFVCRQELLPAKVVLRDYNDQAASHGVLRKEAVVDSKGAGEVTLFGEDFRTDAEGERLALVRAQEIACRSTQYFAEGTATGLRAGYLFTLAAHPYQAALTQKKYLVADIGHEATIRIQGLAAIDGSAPLATQYRVSLRALPFDDPVDGRPLQFRPPRVTTRPRIYGTISAKVDDSTSGQYATLDKQGRYRVLLPFADYARTRDDVSVGTTPATLAGRGSAWIRMATPYSGLWTNPSTGGASTQHLFGMHFPLHKGTEVLLSFIEGDPNRPVIVAAVPNSDDPSVVRGVDRVIKPAQGATPAVTEAEAMISRIQTAGGNKVDLYDREGSERVVMSTPYEETYLRLGKASAGDPHDPKGEYSYYLRSGRVIPPTTPTGTPTMTGAGKAVFPGGFTSITGGLLDSSGNELEFGKQPWEIEHGWDKDIDKLPGSDTELNLNHNITHTKADNIERTCGNNTSTTIGNTNEEIYGNSFSKVRGNSHEDVWGDTLSTHMGTSETFFFGNNLAMSLALNEEFFVGNKFSFSLALSEDIFIGNKFEISLSASESFKFGVNFDFVLAGSVELGFGGKLKLNDGQKEFELGDNWKVNPAMTVEAVNTRLTTLVSQLSSRASHIQSQVTEMGQSVTKLDSSVTKVKTAVNDIATNSGVTIVL